MTLNFTCVFRSIFQEMISMDTLIVQIMNQAQKLVNADRASLFLVDSRSGELHARCIGACRHSTVLHLALKDL